MARIMLEDKNIEFLYVNAVCDLEKPKQSFEFTRIAETKAAPDYGKKATQHTEQSDLLKYQLFICKYLQAHFGKHSNGLQRTIMHTNEEEILSELVYRLFQIRSLDEVQAILNKE
mgnify:CR=1 FL=1